MICIKINRIDFANVGIASVVGNAYTYRDTKDNQ